MQNAPHSPGQAAKNRRQRCTVNPSPDSTRYRPAASKGEPMTLASPPAARLLILGTVRSVQVGRARKHGTPGAADPLQRPWRSAFFKEPVDGAVDVGPLGLAGDEQ